MGSCENWATPSTMRSSYAREQHTRQEDCARELRDLDALNEMRTLRDRRHSYGARKCPSAFPPGLMKLASGRCSPMTPETHSSLPELSCFQYNRRPRRRQPRVDDNEAFCTSTAPAQFKASRSASTGRSWRQNFGFNKNLTNSTVQCAARDARPIKPLGAN